MQRDHAAQRRLKSLGGRLCYRLGSEFACFALQGVNTPGTILPRPGAADAISLILSAKSNPPAIRPDLIMARDAAKWPSALRQASGRTAEAVKVAMRKRVHRDCRAGGPWHIAYCAEVPGANGQGNSREKCFANLREAIALSLEHTREGVIALAAPRCSPGTRYPRMKRESLLYGTSAATVTFCAPLARSIRRKLSIPDPPG